MGILVTRGIYGSALALLAMAYTNCRKSAVDGGKAYSVAF